MATRKGWGWWAQVLLLGAWSVPGMAQCVPETFLAVGRPVPRPSSTEALPSKPPAGSLRPDILSFVSEAQVLAMPTSVIVTATDWTSVSRFEGPLLSDVLKLAPKHGGSLNVSAWNHYEVTLPASDLDRFAPILAHTRDGVRMKRSEFGPLFIVYPRDRYGELRAPNMAARMVWQVCRIDVE